ncbi:MULTISPECIES: YajQ family cyclic di-GMP-binding protein [unclassified Campylobacter]|uniref:YajQ family cyclic di-GMP-binding protein n=1 Tax=unclassified Campylobacter TaxID=2593542 RepID=UPI0022E9A056|nr:MULTISPECIES: YajQ family cyclic di-GMP-binding protein [unclassified Campylobacter]MDA3080022.1 YajQ family cyclic di-GMP-binding protein [Campylobacter sp. CS_NA2]MDA3081760.1 YajQ family cyclic di-GMP-binding protein [Campylobacter sp. CS_NA1]MDA3086079.1 YajQ family cyclic di-GMP-binding protein [Campylobacter sp. CS_ED1]MDA3090972.1 YajQ family cyclic di-GMP-binding protein [Campylobacter sp. CS_ED2]WBR51240.1 YajQ family cyclic di-GMP-binding protein [Campylobacter sp. CS_NA3]
MASEHSFDISASVDLMEVKNALETAKKEVAARYDFKGLTAEISLNEKDKTITLLSSSDNKIDALKDIVISKLIKREIPPVAIKELKREPASGANTRAILKLNDTLETEDAKKITKAIKDAKIKVNAQIRGEEVRVSSKSIDDLQECIKLVKSLNLELPISFRNLK